MKLSRDFTIITIALALARYCLPLLLREIILKCGMRLNHYLDRTDIPKICPRFEQISHQSVFHDFDYQRYSGIWYTFAQNDPTQPKGMCSCDRFEWELVAPGSFRSRLDVMCTLYSPTPIPFTVMHQGQTNATGHKASMLEGCPWMGAKLIPNHVIWIDSDYTACIRYSCQENFLGVPVFSSLQIWTRAPVSPESDQGKALLKQAHELVDFSDEYLDFGHHRDCKHLPLRH